MVLSLAHFVSPTLFFLELLGVRVVVLRTWSVNNTFHLMGMKASASSGKWLGKRNLLYSPESTESGTLGTGTSGPGLISPQISLRHARVCEALHEFSSFQAWL